MNARWFRDNLSVVIFTVAFIGILTGIIIFLRDALTERDNVVQELTTQQGSLADLQGRKPFPSTENIDILKRDQLQVRRLYTTMQSAAIRETNQIPELEREIDFLQFRKATLDRLNDAADKKGVKIGDTFMWGYSRYAANFPCRNPSVKGDACKSLLRSLAKQLILVEHLSDLLISNNVASIQAIRRTEIEPGSSADSLNIPIQDDTKSLYRVYPFEIEFAADTETLRNILNAFAQADTLYAVRSLRLTTSSQVVRAPNQPVVRREPLDFHELDPKRPEPPTMVESRIIGVTLRLDVIEFKPVETKPPKR